MSVPNRLPLPSIQGDAEQPRRKGLSNARRQHEHALAMAIALGTKEHQ
eukprot:gene4340-5531_t